MNVSDFDSALARLMLVDVTWSEWEPEKDRESYEKVINTFLSVPAGYCGSSGPAYLHQCYEKDNSDGTTWIEQTAAYELPPKDACQHPGQWLSGHEGLQRVTSAPAAEREASAQFGGILVHQVRDWGRMFRTRIFMDADCYRSVVKCGGDADYWVLINMHFQRVTHTSVLWHTSFSVWSDLPLSSHHRPAHIASPRARGLSAEDAYNLMEDWGKSRDAFRDFVHSEQRKTLRVFGRSYQPPSFLVAVPEGHHPVLTGDATESSSELNVLRQVSNEILWTQNYESLPRTLLKGGINAFRRFLPLGEFDVPRYLLIPDTQTRVRNQEDMNIWRGIQEEAAAVGVRILTDLEAYAASELRGIDSRMRIRENHLKIYQGVAEQAGTLWDALARLLPDARGRRLEIIHRSIEMIHQTLLQGVADLDQLVRNIDDALSHIESVADEVADRFNRQLDHPPLIKEGRALRDSLRGGYFDRLRRHVREDKSTAARVTESYRMLLETIGMAFDERRVREGDRLQRPGVSLAVAFGVLGLSGVAQATLPIPSVTGGIVLAVRLVLWLLTLVAFLVLFYQVWNLRSLGRVASREFEDRYEKLRRFLADVSTDHLNDFLRSHPRRDPEQQKSWQELDQKLCNSFVDAWGIAEKGQGATKSDPYDAAPLRSRVETWTLQTLMLTERPRDFSRYPLPHLTILYRIYTAEAMKDWNAAEEIPKAYSAVGASELEAALTGNEYEWLNKNEADLREREMKWLCDYLSTEESLGFDLPPL